MKSASKNWFLLCLTLVLFNCGSNKPQPEVRPTIPMEKAYVLLRSEGEENDLTELKNILNSDFITNNISTNIVSYPLARAWNNNQIFTTAYNDNYDYIVLIDQVAKFTIDHKTQVGGKYQIRSYHIKSTNPDWIDLGQKTCNITVKPSIKKFTRQIVSNIVPNYKSSTISFDEEQEYAESSHASNSGYQTFKSSKEIDIEIEELKNQLKLEKEKTDKILAEKERLKKQYEEALAKERQKTEIALTNLKLAQKEKERISQLKAEEEFSRKKQRQKEIAEAIALKREEIRQQELEEALQNPKTTVIEENKEPTREDKIKERLEAKRRLAEERALIRKKQEEDAFKRQEEKKRLAEEKRIQQKRKQEELIKQRNEQKRLAQAKKEQELLEIKKKQEAERLADLAQDKRLEKLKLEEEEAKRKLEKERLLEEKQRLAKLQKIQEAKKLADLAEAKRIEANRIKEEKAKLLEEEQLAKQLEEEKALVEAKRLEKLKLEEEEAKRKLEKESLLEEEQRLAELQEKQEAKRLADLAEAKRIEATRIKEEKVKLLEERRLAKQLEEEKALAQAKQLEKEKLSREEKQLAQAKKEEEEYELKKQLKEKRRLAKAEQDSKAKQNTNRQKPAETKNEPSRTKTSKVGKINTLVILRAKEDDANNIKKLQDNIEFDFLFANAKATTHIYSKDQELDKTIISRQNKSKYDCIIVVDQLDYQGDGFSNYQISTYKTNTYSNWKDDTIQSFNISNRASIKQFSKTITASL